MLADDHLAHFSVTASGRLSCILHKHISGYLDLEQVGYTMSQGFGDYYYHRAISMYNYSWTEWNYTTPPMNLGGEYRTAYNHQGAPIYAKVISLGTLPNNAEKSISCDLRVIGLDAYAVSGGYGFTIPLVRVGYEVYCHFQNGSILVRSNYDVSAYTGYATVYYVKNLW